MRLPWGACPPDRLAHPPAHLTLPPLPLPPCVCGSAGPGRGARDPHHPGGRHVASGAILPPPPCWRRRRRREPAAHHALCGRDAQVGRIGAGRMCVCVVCVCVWGGGGGCCFAALRFACSYESPPLPPPLPPPPGAPGRGAWATARWAATTRPRSSRRSRRRRPTARTRCSTPSKSRTR